MILTFRGELITAPPPRVEQQPFLQGFYPVMQLYLQLDRNIAAANLDTRAQLVTKDNVDKVGKRFEN